MLLDFSGAHKVLTLFIVLESGKFMYFTEVLHSSPYIQKEKKFRTKETVDG